jgi:hypothetical protein
MQSVPVQLSLVPFEHLADESAEAGLMMSQADVTTRLRQAANRRKNLFITGELLWVSSLKKPVTLWMKVRSRRPRHLAAADGSYGERLILGRRQNVRRIEVGFPNRRETNTRENPAQYAQNLLPIPRTCQYELFTRQSRHRN